MSTVNPINVTNLPASDGIAITPVDSPLSKPLRAFYVGVTGNVRIITPQGTTLTWVAVPAGKIIPMGAIQVSATGTTATSIIGIY